MARYLTPAKIGLLALVELYTEEAVPGVAVLPVLSFITSHLMDHDSTDPLSSQEARWTKAERTVGLVITIKDFEKLLGSYPSLLGMPGRRLWDQFLVKLWDMNSLDALNDFFDRITDLLARTKGENRRDGEDDPDEVDSKIRLSRNSPFGAFIRRSRLEYQRLRFHDCTELWKAFVRYRQPTAHYLRRKNPNFGRLSFDNVLLLGEQEDWDPASVSALAAVAYGDMLTGDESSTIPVSTDDVESLLEFQIEQMQSKEYLALRVREDSRLTGIEYGNRIPLEIRHQFHDLLHDSFLVPSLTHYLRYDSLLCTEQFEYFLIRHIAFSMLGDPGTTPPRLTFFTGTLTILCSIEIGCFTSMHS